MSELTSEFNPENYQLIQTAADFDIGVSQDGSEAVAYLGTEEPDVEIDANEMISEVYRQLGEDSEIDTYRAVIDFEETVDESTEDTHTYHKSHYKEEVIMSADSVERLLE